jgi:hypothetical protein
VRSDRPRRRHNEAAMQATHAAVKEVLRTVFKLN